jgi:purine-nucleoside phosphorylase
MNDLYLFGPKDLIQHLKKSGKPVMGFIPKTAILCFSPSVATELTKVNSWRVEHFLGAKWSMVSEKLVILSGFGMGSPSAVAKIEELKVLGVKRILFIGSAGSLQADLGIGEVVIGVKAIAAEGTSRHYTSKLEIAAHSGWSKEIAKYLQAKARQGAVWATDAPYREPRKLLRELELRGVLSVDMESSAIYAASEVLGLAAVGVFVISDSLHDGIWNPQFSNPKVRQIFLKILSGLVKELK